jgi:hypothetical protein
VLIAAAMTQVRSARASPAGLRLKTAIESRFPSWTVGIIADRRGISPPSGRAAHGGKGGSDALAWFAKIELRTRERRHAGGAQVEGPGPRACHLSSGVSQSGA